MNDLIKRTFDILFSSLLIILLLPLLVLIFFILLGSGHTPIFVQSRYGRHGRLFPMLKYRTMRNTAQQLQDQIKNGELSVLNITQEESITRVGRFLRSTGLDELPQLFNILKGDMSFVGPRPITKEETDSLKDEFKSYLTVKPGLTCLWQLSRPQGPRDMNLKHRLDQQYISSQTIWLDFKLIMLSASLFLKLLFRKKR